MSDLKKHKTLFLILGSYAPENQMDLKIQRETWLKSLLPNQEYLVIRGSNEESARLEGDTLFLPVIETYENILEKTLLGFRWALDNSDFQVLIRTNVSTYFPVKLVDKKIRDIDPLSCYFGGYKDYCWLPGNADRRKVSYVTGTAIVLTRPTVEMLCESNLELMTALPDDVAISLTLSDSGIPVENIKRNDLGSSHIFYPRFQIRLKTSSVSHLASTRMQNVHDFFQAENFLKKFYYYFKITLSEVKYATMNFDQFLSFCRFSLRYLKKLVSNKSNGEQHT